MPRSTAWATVLCPTGRLMRGPILPSWIVLRRVAQVVMGHKVEGTRLWREHVNSRRVGMHQVGGLVGDQ